VFKVLNHYQDQQKESWKRSPGVIPVGFFDWLKARFTTSTSPESEKRRKRREDEEEQEIEELLAIDII
jgi:uncharacterized protein YcaQ